MTRRLATRWLSEFTPVPGVDLRFDVVSGTAGKVELIEGAY